MAIWRQKINDCEHCGGIGVIPAPREPWEAPIYGDDTITCPVCHGTPQAPRAPRPQKEPKR